MEFVTTLLGQQPLMALFLDGALATRIAARAT